MTERDLQRWSREVAEDPGAPSFVRLARAYRRQGRRRASRDVVLAGLQRHPEHVEAHALLALLLIEDGERERARDEWEIVLRLDPGSFDASRGLGFLALERGDLPAARRHLDTAASARPDDPAVAQARKVLDRREAGAAPPARPAGPATAGPAAPSGAQPAGAQQAGAQQAGAVQAPGGRSARSAAASGVAMDPHRLFEPLAKEGPFLGALVLDEQGLQVAGALEAGGEPELLVGLLATAVQEARRVSSILKMGDWEGLLLDCEDVTLHVAPVANAILLVAARRGAPAGWVVRTGERAQELARRFLEVSS